MPPEAAEILRLIKSLHLFSRLSEESLLGLIAASNTAVYRPGEVIHRASENLDHFCIILEGEARIKAWSDDPDHPQELLSAGDYFGTEELLYNRASPTVTAMEPLRLLRIPGQEFQAFLHTHPQIRSGLQVAASSRRLLRRIAIDWLRPAEVVYFIGRKHRFFLYRNLIIPMIIAVLAFASLLVLYGAGVTNVLPFLGAGGIGGLGLIWLGWNLLDWSNDHYLITNQRVVWLERIAGIYDSRQEAPLNTILSVGIGTSQTGRILGFGDVNVRTYTGTITFKRVSRPDQVAALVEEHWSRSRTTHQKEETQAMSQAIRQRLGRELPEGAELPLEAAPPPAVEAVVQPGALTRAFSNLFRMRFEEGPVVTYRKHWFVLIRRTWKPFAWCLLAAVLAGARLAGLISILNLDTFLLLDGIFFTVMFLWYLYEYLDWHNDIYQVTPDQIIDLEKKPLGREDKRAAPIDNILSIEYERLGIFGLLFNFGTVTINVGISQFTFDFVYNPLQVQKDLFNRLEERRAQKQQEERQAERERVSGWFATYDEISHPEAQPLRDEEDPGFENTPGDRQFWG